MKNTIRIFVLIILSGCFSASCDSYLDVVPDNIATIDHAFTDRNQAEKYLHTVYSYLPKIGLVMVEGRYDDLTWQGRTAIATAGYGGGNICPLVALRDGNRASDPYCNNWDGTQQGTPLFQAIRDCNIFLEKIGDVRDLQIYEKSRWIAEAKFLKAYYHFLLLQQYGPIPIVDVNLDVWADESEVMVERLPVDVVFDYIFRLMDESMFDLPEKIEDVALEMGRISLPAALAVKAKIAVTAASPQFNGNNITYASFVNSKGQPFFSAYSHEKWERAVAACKQAVDSCVNAGHGLYEYAGETDMSEETKKIVQSGRIFTEKWNKEKIWSMVWVAPSSLVPLEEATTPALHTDHASYCRQSVNPTMKAVEMFYSKNGVPIEEDRFYDYDNRYETALTTAADNRFVQPGVVTAQLHLNREYRFYGSIAFDGGWWFGRSRYDENNQWPVNTKNGNMSGQRGLERYSCTAFYIRKLSNIESTFSGTAIVPVRSDYPILRLADLYLLYAEALNEYLDAPNQEVWDYVNLVRERAGLETVQYAWTNFAKTPDKYTTQPGMRDIIRRERTIELMFEGHRLFDLRRWNIATTELTGPVRGWNYMQGATEDFYQLFTVENILFTDRDMLAPIRTSELVKNRNLIQNPGWQ